MLLLRPLLVTPCANAFGGVVFPFIVFFAFDTVFAFDEHVAEILLVPAAAASLIFVVRGFLMSVVCAPDAITVRGYPRSRTIPIADVLELDDGLLFLLRWQDRRGRRRGTPVIAFTAPPSTLAFVVRHNDDCAARLREWIGRHRGAA
ncbi:hypothetical protein SAMN05444920_110161 [Nonomuraea solani]|uniref:PH domain-containing protein n=1 Tax=Nonomuraea solani TaxID=1144553 RepID=A0A1H6EI16_9ACTN|nr:hypothetical protein [Nonomuraea solani]SEG96943.1 hypothetical protein SAMN05444920_110161 [Nonomuraea solani]